MTPLSRFQASFLLAIVFVSWRLAVAEAIITNTHANIYGSSLEGNAFQSDLMKMKVERKEKLRTAQEKDVLLRRLKANGAFKNDRVIKENTIDSIKAQQPRDVALVMASTMRRAGTNGPCSSYLSAPIINVATPNDFTKRLAFPANQTVILIVVQPLVLASGLIFDGNFSCTIIQAPDASIDSGAGMDISLADGSQPALRIWNTSNVMLVGINVKLNVTNESPFCDPYVPELFPLRNTTVCPSIHVYRSYGIVIAKGSMYGRVDICRSLYVTVDSNKLTGPDIYEVSPGAIRVWRSGLGGILFGSHIVISNNEIYGVNTPVALIFGAIGVSVINNFIHSFIWTGIRCGMNTHFLGDCMLSSLAYNFVYNPPGYPVDYDSTGIYFYTHWVNPGNAVTCNYVIGSYHCMYLDNMASGIRITGGVCTNTFDGIKVNGGKNNIIKGVLTYNLVQNTPAWMSCLFRESFNCLLDPGTWWEQWRIAKYNTPEINTLYPYLSSICAATSINGVSCNPSWSVPAKITGNCSGMPTENIVDMIMIDAGYRNPEYRYNEDLPVVSLLNSAIFLNISSTQAGLNNITDNDFGLTRSSPLRVIRRGIRSCPKALVGIQPVARASYYKMWNINEPTNMDLVRTVKEYWVAGYI